MPSRSSSESQSGWPGSGAHGGAFSPSHARHPYDPSARREVCRDLRDVCRAAMRERCVCRDEREMSRRERGEVCRDEREVSRRERGVS